MNKFKGFLDKVKDKVEDVDVIGVAGKALTGNIGGAIGDLMTGLSGSASPEAESLLNELKMRQMEFEKEMYALEVEDRKSARDMYVNAEHSQANKIADNVMRFNLIVICAMVCIQVLVIMYIDGQIAAVITGIVGTITGALINERNTVVNFFFGSSQGSKDKDK
jgi:hypothetical protein